ncbi:MAG: sulfotransferase [Chloroflexi bacterium]|nr:sulfotransferase [Chloroflexota bacterium]
MLTTARRLRPGGLAATLPPADGDSPFVIVTGTGRSGTSAVARVLHESGIRLGNTFDPPSEQNRAGFYEDIEVRAINFGIVTELGLSDIGRALRWPWRSAMLAVAARYAGEMQTLAAGGAGGWKDPIFCVTLEAWLPYLPRRPKVVVCLRSSEAFLHSVTQIYGLVQRDNVERLWANELRRLLAVIRDYRLDAICIEYDDLLLSPEEAVERLSSFVGRPLDAAYVDSTLRHHEYSVPERHTALYARVQSLGTRGAAREQTLPKQSPAEVSEIESYLQRIHSIDVDVTAAHEAWAAAAGAPTLTLDEPERVRVASAAYVETVSAAQTELGALPPPAGFAGYHEATRAAVNDHRLVAQVTLQAAERQRPTSEASRTYEHCLSPEAIAASAKRRARAYKRALKSSGYREREPVRE